MLVKVSDRAWTLLAMLTAPAPVLFAKTNGQVGAIVPYSTAGKSLVAIRVEDQGRKSNDLAVAVASTAPANTEL